MGYYDKAGSSTIQKAQVLSWTGTGTVVSTNFAAQTRQVRVISPLAGWIAIDNLGTVPTTAGLTGTFIAANTAAGDYFSCNPGQLLSFSSTSTGTATVSVTELT